MNDMLPDRIQIENYKRNPDGHTADIIAVVPVPRHAGNRSGPWRTERCILREVPVDGSNINWARWSPATGQARLFTLWKHYKLLPVTLPYAEREGSWDDLSLKLEDGSEILVA